MRVRDHRAYRLNLFAWAEEHAAMNRFQVEEEIAALERQIGTLEGERDTLSQGLVAQKRVQVKRLRAQLAELPEAPPPRRAPAPVPALPPVEEPEPPPTSGDITPAQMRQARAALGLSQREVAERAGISPITYGAIERGATPGSTWSRQRIAKALGLAAAPAAEEEPEEDAPEAEDAEEQPAEDAEEPLEQPAHLGLLGEVEEVPAAPEPLAPEPQPPVQGVLPGLDALEKDWAPKRPSATVLVAVIQRIELELAKEGDQ